VPIFGGLVLFLPDFPISVAPASTGVNCAHKQTVLGGKTMEEIIENVSESLIRRGFARRDTNTWVWLNMTVIYREQDSSFLAYQKTAELEEFEFFDCHFAGENRPLSCGSKPATPRCLSSYQFYFFGQAFLSASSEVKRAGAVLRAF
jgi:hypothetical protein